MALCSLKKRTNHLIIAMALSYAGESGWDTPVSLLS